MRLRYPWAIAPTINTTKPVATAMATFVSIDNSIIFPSITATVTSPPFFDSSFLDRFEFQRAYGCQAERKEEAAGKRSFVTGRSEVVLYLSRAILGERLHFGIRSFGFRRGQEQSRSQSVGS